MRIQLYMFEYHQHTLSRFPRKRHTPAQAIQMPYKFHFVEWVQGTSCCCTPTHQCSNLVGQTVDFGALQPIDQHGGCEQSLHDPCGACKLGTGLSRTNLFGGWSVDGGASLLFSMWCVVADKTSGAVLEAGLVRWGGVGAWSLRFRWATTACRGWATAFKGTWHYFVSAVGSCFFCTRRLQVWKSEVGWSSGCSLARDVRAFAHLPRMSVGHWVRPSTREDSD